MKQKILLAGLVVATLLGGCGGGDSSPGAEVFPREIQYENLKGQTGGVILGSGMSITQSDTTNCVLGKFWCLSSLMTLTSQEQFKAFVAQSPGNEDSKSEVLTAGNAIDFSKKQLWALKLGRLYTADIVLKIHELEKTIEIQPVICNDAVVGNGVRFLTDIFVVVSRDTPVKPFVFIDNSPVLYGPKCPFAEMVRRS
jgi:hypothetical protein